MIIRERNEEFIIIKQHDHAQLSKQLYDHLLERFFPNGDYKYSVGLAINLHDCGWIPFDESPFWNDTSHSPYAFTEFPTPPKTVLYQQGINYVEGKDAYAALLCSEHYIRFMERSNEEIAKRFVENERRRQKKLQKEINLSENQWVYDYEILQFLDNLSLFICLNEPGTKQSDNHYFFKKGIKIPNRFNLSGPLSPTWTSGDTITLDQTLLKNDININLKQTPVSKQEISDYGLLKAYTLSEEEVVPLKINK